MNYWKIFWLIPILIIGTLIFGIIRGGMIMHKENSAMHNKCIKTDLYVIGDKGHRNRIYDCSDVEL